MKRIEISTKRNQVNRVYVILLSFMTLISLEGSLNHYALPKYNLAFDTSTVLVIAPHDSSNKNNWDVLLAEFIDSDGAHSWTDFSMSKLDFETDPIMTASRALAQPSSIDAIFNKSAQELVSYIKNSCVYTYFFPDKSVTFVTCFSDRTINEYISSLHATLYRKSKKERKAGIQNVALVPWRELLDAVRAHSAGGHVTLSARVLKKSVRKAQPTFFTDTITLDTSLWERLSPVAHKKRYVRGKRAGVRIYS